MNKVRKVCVFGDVMLDQWTVVEPTRVSSEAPVLITEYRGTSYSPGGAGNAAVNCAHMGADVSIVGLYGKGIGNEDYSTELLSALKKNKVNTEFMLGCCEWPTILKHRIVDTQGRHLLRLDREERMKTMDLREIMAFQQIFGIVQETHEVLFVSDYGKGTCYPDLTQKIILRWRARGSGFIIVNGKPENIRAYDGADVLVFNRSEAESVTGKLGYAATTLAAHIANHHSPEVRNIVVTDGAKGLAWHSGFSRLANMIHAPTVAVADVAGAGDTICATLARCGAISLAILQAAVENAAKVVSQRGTSVPL